MKVLVVGMNPSSKPTLNGKANATFKKLESWMDDVGVHYFSFVNTFDDPSQAQHSKVDYNRLVQLSKNYDKIIALGNFVSNSLNRVNVTHFKMPHPSPLNRLLNDKTYESKMIKRCKEYLQ